MFLISDTVESRRAKIESFQNEDEASIALLLAVFDLERTFRRAILALGMTRTKELNARLGVGDQSKRPKLDRKKKQTRFKYRATLDGIHDAWKDEVQGQFTTAKAIPDGLISNKVWGRVREAFNLRHDLVHGSRGPVSSDFSKVRIDAVLQLTEALEEAVKQVYEDDKVEHDLRKPVRRRLKDRPSRLQK
jgi:hypothetical protein